MIDGEKGLHIHNHNQDHIAQIRSLAQNFCCECSPDRKCELGIVFQAISAGISDDHESLLMFEKEMSEKNDCPSRDTAVTMLICLLVQAKNFIEARKFAANLFIWDHHIAHAMAMTIIAQHSGDTEDLGVASEAMRYLLDRQFGVSAV